MNVAPLLLPARERVRGLARDAVEARGGDVFELRGDEAVAIFEDPLQAIRAAVELQQAWAEALAADPTIPLLAWIGSPARSDRR